MLNNTHPTWKRIDGQPANDREMYLFDADAFAEVMHAGRYTSRCHGMIGMQPAAILWQNRRVNWRIRPFTRMQYYPSRLPG